jgi:hypothetical protein
LGLSPFLGDLTATLTAKLEAIEFCLCSLSDISSVRPSQALHCIITTRSCGIYLRYAVIYFHLAINMGGVWTRDELLAQVWGADYIAYDRVVDVTIARLRQALGVSGALIETMPGFGYRLAQAEVVQPARS